MPIVDAGKTNEDGYVLLVTLLLLLMLTIVGFAATYTASVEAQVSGNNRKIVEDFYVAEGALITAMENSDWWLGDLLNKNGMADVHWSGHVDIDGDDTNDALIEIRCVEQSETNIAALSRAANNIPADLHIAPPPINSGYSARHFNIRKYAVTATDTKSGIHIQSGTWKVFGKH